MAATSTEARLLRPVRRDAPSAPRRWPRWLGAGLLIVALLGWFTPTLIAATGLAGWLVRRATADLRGQLSVGSLSLGWLSPVRAERIELRDDQGQPVAQAAEIATEKSLWGLLTAGGRLGQITLRAPKLEWVVTPDGSNLENVLRPILDRKHGQAAESTEIDFSLLIEDGELTIRDVAGSRVWQLAPLEATVAVPRDRLQPLAVTANVQIAGGPKPGRVALEAKVLRPAKPDELPIPTQARLEALGFPLELLEPLLARVQPGIAVAGTLTAGFAAQSADVDGQTKVSLSGQAAAAGLRLQFPTWQEPLALAALEIPVQASLRGEVLTIEQLAIDTDVGQATAAGSVRLTELWAGRWLAALTDAPCQLVGRLDLAALARLMPGTLRIREGLVVRSGGVDWLLAGRPAGAGYEWSGRVTASELAAVQAGRAITWRDPLVAEFQVRRDRQSLVVQRL
jgi:translocation and assembly module TamB